VVDGQWVFASGCFSLLFGLFWWQGGLRRRVPDVRTRSPTV
jgi:hypothetical protein